MLDLAPPPAALEFTTLERIFSLIIFDWDGTAVYDRRSDARALGAAMDRILRAGAHLAVVTGTSFSQIDGALAGAIRGPHIARLLVATNRGSELYGYDASGEPMLLARRGATPAEDEALDTAADRVAEAVRSATGLDVRVVRDRLNRRKIDLFPSWSDPPKARIAELVDAVEARLAAAGWRGGVAEVVRRVRAEGAACGLAEPRVTSDGKHVELGLTDKSDAVDGVIAWTAEPASGVLLVGDEVGPVGGVPGSDARLRTAALADALLVSVGPEPGGVPPGVLHLGGGPARFVALLDAQAARRAAQGGDVSVGLAEPVAPTDDPVRRLVEHGFALVREHEIESRFTVGNGAAAVRGAISEGTPLSAPGTRIAGAWLHAGHTKLPTLACAPAWTGLRVRVGGVDLALTAGAADHQRVLDLTQGVYWRSWRHVDEEGRVTHLRVARFASLADRRLLAERVELTTENWGGPLEVEALVRAADGWTRDGPTTWTGPGRCALGLAFHGVPADPLEGAPHLDPASPAGLWRVVTRPGATWRLDRALTVARGPIDAAEAASHADASPSLLALPERSVGTGGLDHAVAAHSVACRARVHALSVTLDGDLPLQRALAFAAHHLVAAANPEDDRVSVGARALTGAAYMGHVFWDTELWLLPVYTLTWPRAARALCRYRWHLLPAARARARAMGYRGALYAWESAATGEDVTPPVVRMPDGREARVFAGLREHHVSAAVAWAAWHYWRWTGDDAYFRDGGAEVILETARFWASRGRMEADGRFHIRHVMGPDEHHEDVDDNAYTNGMAAWNLQRGAEVARRFAKAWPARWASLSATLALTPEEPAAWEAAAAAMYTGLDPATGLIEQFSGYFQLEDVSLAALEPRTAPVDVLLGPDRVRGSQLVKQADVLLLLQLLGDRFPPEVHAANFHYYAPRTAHGSSLSPSIHASAAARLGEEAAAERYLRQTASIDLDDRLGSAAGGVHIGALGGLWQAVVFGYAGLGFGRDGPTLAPRMPAWMRRVSFPFIWRERRYRAEIDGGRGRLVPEGAW